MALSRRNFLKLSGTAAAATTLAGMSHVGITHAQNAESIALAADDPLLHLVNRITWGATPAELAHARAIGYNAYLEEQLNPEMITDPEGDAVWQSRPILSMDRNTLARFRGQEYRTHETLIGGMVELATVSSRQLQERMVDFWFDHFNVHIAGEEIVADGVLYLKDAIRPHVFGNFRSLVLATAKSPAMLRYLDNETNIAADPNENYARELMELHTLGVDGGYTEQDVVEVARALTGWTIHDSTRDGFFFDHETHDTNPKQILGHNLPAGRGIEDGLHVINILVNHPATSQFVSRKLCVRFVSDNPSQDLVDSTAEVWRQNNGEIKPVLRHIFSSEEFLQSAGQKFRRPLEFFIAMKRVTGADFREDEIMYQALQQLSQVPFNWAPPNGYPDVANAWLNTNNLLKRWNVAMLLTGEFASREPQVDLDLTTGLGTPQTAGDLVQTVGQRVFGVALPAEQAAPFVDYVSDGQGAATPFTAGMQAQKLASLYGLMLASPLFQWR